MDQQAYPMQEQVPPVQIAPPQPAYPAQGYLPPQNYPPQGPPPPTYQPEYNYQPQPIAPGTATNTILVADAPYQPPHAQEFRVDDKPPKEPGNGRGVAIAAIVISAFSLCCCSFGVLVPFFIPALCLAICAATGSKGRRNRKCCACISIGLNVLFILTEVLFIIIFFPVFNATASYCSPYYSTTYSTICVPVLARAYTCTYNPGFLSPCVSGNCFCPV